MADYTPLAAKTRHLPPSPARDLAEWRVLAGNGGLHAIARQNMPIAAIVRPCPPKHTNNRRFHVLVFEKNGHKNYTISFLSPRQGSQGSTARLTSTNAHRDRVRTEECVRTKSTATVVTAAKQVREAIAVYLARDAFSVCLPPSS